MPGRGRDLGDMRVVPIPQFPDGPKPACVQPQRHIGSAQTAGEPDVSFRGRAATFRSSAAQAAHSARTAASPSGIQGGLAGTHFKGSPGLLPCTARGKPELQETWKQVNGLWSLQHLVSYLAVRNASAAAPSAGRRNRTPSCTATYRLRWMALAVRPEPRIPFPTACPSSAWWGAAAPCATLQTPRM